MTASQLLQQIRAAFPPERFFGSVTNGCTCDECTELASSLRHQDWSTISDDSMDAQFGSLPLLSQEARLAFLPAWLTRSLSNLDAAEHKVREWTLYELALYYDAEEDEPSDVAAKTERLRGLYEALRPEQVLVVERWLKFIRENARISDWDRESIGRALHLTSKIGRTHPVLPPPTSSSA